MKHLLVTGFGRFPGWATNPTRKIVQTISRTRFQGMKVTTHVFDTEYEGVARDLPKLIARVKPDAVLLFGLAGRAPVLRIERNAHNVTNRLKPDASGRFFTSRALEPGGPARRTTSVSTRALAALLTSEGLKARSSRSAGDYLCNFAYGLALKAVAAGEIKSALFIHVPMPRSGETPKKRSTKFRMNANDLDRSGLIAVRWMATNLRR